MQIAMSLDINYLISVAEKAGQAIMAIYEGDASNWDVDHKEDNSPLTRADKEANKIICDALIDWTPHIPIISEENSNASFSVRKVHDVTWLLHFCRCLLQFSCNFARGKDGTGQHLQAQVFSSFFVDFIVCIAFLCSQVS
jgi:hypothetical protein